MLGSKLIKKVHRRLSSTPGRKGGTSPPHFSFTPSFSFCICLCYLSLFAYVYVTFLFLSEEEEETETTIISASVLKEDTTLFKPVVESAYVSLSFFPLSFPFLSPLISFLLFLRMVRVGIVPSVRGRTLCLMKSAASAEPFDQS